jgi:hypothetical protein
MAKPKGQLAGVKQQRARADRHNAGDQKKFAKFAHRVH